MEELNRKVPQLPWIVATIGIILAGYFFLSMSKVNTEISVGQNEMNSYKLRLEQYEKLESVYGHGSDRYYADKPLLILKTEDSEDKIKIFCDLFKENDDANTRWETDNDADITVKWESKFDSETYTTNIVVAPGKKAGCYPITFTNSVNDDTFQVLVIVK